MKINYFIMEGKKVLVIYAHPEEQSFVSSMKNRCVDAFKKQGCVVTVRDLYQLGFTAVGGPEDFTDSNPEDIEKFRYAAAQKKGIIDGTVKEDLKVEQDYLANTDFLVLVFPMWWSTVPAIMKGWIDRVLFQGVAWDMEGFQLFQNGKLKGKKALCVLSTGAPLESFSETGQAKMTIEERMEHLTYGTLAFCGLNVYPIFAATGVSAMTPKEELEKKLTELEKYIEDLPTKTFTY